MRLGGGPAVLPNSHRIPPPNSPPNTPHYTMASLNTSTNGPNITRSYQNVINTPPPSGAQSQSPTYGQWAVFVVTAPLVSAFQNEGGKESVLKVQSTGGTSNQSSGAQLPRTKPKPKHLETCSCLGPVLCPQAQLREPVQPKLGLSTPPPCRSSCSCSCTEAAQYAIKSFTNERLQRVNCST